MPIYPPRPDPFDCVICGRTKPLRWTSPDQMDFPPVCWSCEQFSYRTGPVNRKPDVRIAKQIAALAEAITHESNLQGWKGGSCVRA